MQLYKFYVSGTLQHEVWASSKNTAMQKVNDRLPYGFYGWLDVGEDSFSAMFGAWD